MWIFTELGFFSVVRADDDDDGTPLVMVRARVRADLEELVKRLEPMTMIIEWHGRDYPYRVIISREAWADVLYGLGIELDYPNFKNRISELGQDARSRIYSTVWHALLGIERRIGDPVRNRSLYEL